MERHAVFVDAGYLIAEGAQLVGGRKRQDVECNYTGLVRLLKFHCLNHSRLQLLRIYWYDGAPNEVPLADHLEIGRLAGVKLRLGRLVHGEQKGVDSLIVRDLMTLARERAIATAYVLSGDEDIRVGVAAAQEMGVSVVLLGVPGRQNQAATLIREADDHELLGEKSLQGQISLRVVPSKPQLDPEQSEEEAARNFGSEFGTGWAHSATTSELLELLGLSPTIPRALDGEMVAKAQKTLGDLNEREDLRRQLRTGFWSALAAARAVETAPGRPIETEPLAPEQPPATEQ